MNSKEHVIALDIGTSGCRAAVISRDGLRMVASSKLEYPQTVHDPEEIYSAVLRVLGEVLKTRVPVQSVVFGSVLHSMVPVNSTGRPAGPLTTWADNSGAQACLRFEPVYRRDDYYTRTGCILSPVYPLYRLLHRNDGKSKILSIKSYIINRMFGCMAEDHSVASGTGLFNPALRKWDEEILDAAGIEKEQMPDLFPVEHALELPCRVDTGLPADVSWIIGGYDGAMAHLGSAGKGQDTASLTAGTSGAVRVASPKMISGGGGRIWSYVMDSGSYLHGEATNNAGNVIGWYMKNFLPAGTSWESAAEGLKNTPFSPDLFFIPHIFPERDMRPYGGGGFSGLKDRHGAYDMFRAVIEGVAFNLACMVNGLKRTFPVRRVSASGGVTALSLFTQVLRESLDSVAVSSAGPDAALYGAALLGFKTADAASFSPDAIPVFESGYMAKYERWRLLAGLE